MKIVICLLASIVLAGCACSNKQDEISFKRCIDQGGIPLMWKDNCVMRDCLFKDEVQKKRTVIIKKNEGTK